jgi:hypothetical protein
MARQHFEQKSLRPGSKFGQFRNAVLLELPRYGLVMFRDTQEEQQLIAAGRHGFGFTRNTRLHNTRFSQSVNQEPGDIFFHRAGLPANLDDHTAVFSSEAIL